MELKPVSPTAKAPAKAFTGDVYVNRMKQAEEPSRLIASLVRFTPGARTNWHSHALGQTLHCTDGIVRLFSVWGGRVVFTRDVALRRPGSGGCGHADDLVPGGESRVHLVAVTGCGESVSAGPTVR